jgi:predicted dehydrogenase
VLGDIRHIRALWHRNNSWPFNPSAKERATYASGKDLDGQPFDVPFYRDGWYKPILQEDADVFLQDPKKLTEAGFSTIRELVRWRLYEKTGGGLMAELGSHQLDAASIILGHVHPLAVQGVGGKFFYRPGRNDRESDDAVFVTYEFPGPNHPKAGKGGNDPDDIVIVTYSSFNTNSFEKYGECVMGSRGTMIIEEEREVYLFKEPEPGKAGSGGRETRLVVSNAGKGPVLEATSTWGGGGGAAISKSASAPAWDSAVRGYRTEMEHFAYCVRRWQEMKQPVSYDKDTNGRLKYADILPRCHGEVALADAIVALTANLAMANRQRITFEDDWFDADKPTATPEAKYARSRA